MAGCVMYIYWNGICATFNEFVNLSSRQMKIYKMHEATKIH